MLPNNEIGLSWDEIGPIGAVIVLNFIVFIKQCCLTEENSRDIKEERK